MSLLPEFCNGRQILFSFSFTDSVFVVFLLSAVARVGSFGVSSSQVNAGSVKLRSEFVFDLVGGVNKGGFLLGVALEGKKMIQRLLIPLVLATGGIGLGVGAVILSRHGSLVGLLLGVPGVLSLLLSTFYICESSICQNPFMQWPSSIKLCD